METEQYEHSSFPVGQNLENTHALMHTQQLSGTMLLWQSGFYQFESCLGKSQGIFTADLQVLLPPLEEGGLSVWVSA